MTDEDGVAHYLSRRRTEMREWAFVGAGGRARFNDQVGSKAASLCL
jgi:hypothetical protein